MEIVSTNMLLNIAATELSAADPTTLAPDAQATARFAEIMQANPTTPVSGEQAVASEVAVSVNGTSQTVGERILGGLSSLSADFQHNWKSVAAAMDGKSMTTTADMLNLQINLTQMAVQYDLFGKAISRSTQNIDQLVKMQ